MELEKNWDLENGEKIMERGIFQVDSLLENSILKRVRGGGPSHFAENGSGV